MVLLVFFIKCWLFWRLRRLFCGFKGWVFFGWVGVIGVIGIGEVFFNFILVWVGGFGVIGIGEDFFNFIFFLGWVLSGSCKSVKVIKFGRIKLNVK